MSTEKHIFYGLPRVSRQGCLFCCREAIKNDQPVERLKQ